MILRVGLLVVLRSMPLHFHCLLACVWWFDLVALTILFVVLVSLLGFT